MDINKLSELKITYAHPTFQQVTNSSDIIIELNDYSILNIHNDGYLDMIIKYIDIEDFIEYCGFEKEEFDKMYILDEKLTLFLHKNFSDKINKIYTASL
jgi:hypothetical protein